MAAQIPDICAYDCPFADFPPAETAGLCHTMSAVWCRKLRRLTRKNTPCEWKATAQATTGRKPAACKPRPARQTRGRTPRRPRK